MGPEKEFSKYESERAWDAIFFKIRSDSERLHSYSIDDSKKPEYRHLNRYRDVSPYDHSRVSLQRFGIDYINANLIQAEGCDRRYILTQGPLSHTCGHFWLMVWEQNSKAVIMLNHVIEKGRVKCHQYFPLGGAEEEDNEMIFEDVNLKVTFTGSDVQPNYTIRTFLLVDLETNESHEVDQYHYTTWPDFGVPTSPDAFLEFLYHVRNSGAFESNVGPAVIHCSAGIGRSGTLIMADIALLMIKKTGDPNSVNIIDMVIELRKYRMGLIQTPDQLRFLFQAVIEGTHIIMKEQLRFSLPLSVQSRKPTLNNTQDSLVEATSNSNHTNNNRNVEDGNSVNLHEIPTDDASDLEKSSADLENSTNVLSTKEAKELRQRRREDRTKRTRDKIEEMKRKQADCELWKKRKQSWQPRIFGLGITMLIGSIFFYKLYYSS